MAKNFRGPLFAAPPLYVYYSTQISLISLRVYMQITYSVGLHTKEAYTV